MVVVGAILTEPFHVLILFWQFQISSFPKDPQSLIRTILKFFFATFFFSYNRSYIYIGSLHSIWHKLRLISSKTDALIVKQTKKNGAITDLEVAFIVGNVVVTHAASKIYRSWKLLNHPHLVYKMYIKSRLFRFCSNVEYVSRCFVQYNTKVLELMEFKTCSKPFQLLVTKTFEQKYFWICTTQIQVPVTGAVLNILKMSYDQHMKLLSCPNTPSLLNLIFIIFNYFYVYQVLEDWFRFTRFNIEKNACKSDFIEHNRIHHNTHLLFPFVETVFFPLSI